MKLAVLFVGALLQASLSQARRPEDDVARWIEDLRATDPFRSELAAAELRRIGPDALDELVESANESDGPFRLNLEELARQILYSLVLELDGEYRSLDSDRREFELLKARQDALEELKRLRDDRARWIVEYPRILEMAVDYFVLQEMEARAAREDAQGDEPAPGDQTGKDARTYDELKKKVDGFEASIPEFSAKAKALARLEVLESQLSGLKQLSEVEVMRMQDLEKRYKEREPRVEALLAKLHSVGPLAYSVLGAHRESLPLERSPRGRDWRPSVVIFYDKILRDALDRLREGALFPADEEFERARYSLSLLWATEADNKGPSAEQAEKLLRRHLEATLLSLTSSAPIERERAQEEFFLLGERGREVLVEAVDARRERGKGEVLASLEFLAHLCRWRISPETYAKVGIHFQEYPELSFTGRRRKIFQYARAAGHLALPTLRRIVLDDQIEPAFILKYAAAKALATRLGDRLGYVVLQARHPEIVLQRPEISRDLFILEGLAYIRAKDYNRAVEEFAKILEEFPFDFEGNYHTAFAYLLLGNYARAIHHFEIARRIRPKDTLTLYNLACAYSLAGSAPKALEALNESVDAGFNDPDHMEKDADLDPIRDEPGYQQILEKAKTKAQAAP